MIDLGAGQNAINNLESGQLNTGLFVKLGSGNLLTNEGKLSPGGSDTVLATNLTGNLVQAESGAFCVDLDLDVYQTDRLNVSGISQMAGLAGINPHP